MQTPWIGDSCWHYRGTVSFLKSKGNISPAIKISLSSLCPTHLPFLNLALSLILLVSVGNWILDVPPRCPFENEGIFAPQAVHPLPRQPWWKRATLPRLTSNDRCRDRKAQLSHPNSGQLRITHSLELLGVAVISIEAASLHKLSPCPILFHCL